MNREAREALHVDVDNVPADLLEKIGRMLVENMNLKPDPQYPDRAQTGWGTKTYQGLGATTLEQIRRIAEGQD